MAKVYNALSNRVRRQIIEILRTRQSAGFKDLHETVKTSVGALYHHLDALEGLIAQTPDKKYVLTDQGRAAIEAFGVTEEKFAAQNLHSPPETRLGLLTKELFFGRSLFLQISQHPVLSFAVAVPLMFLAGWASAMTNLEPLLLFYLNSSSATNPWLLVMLFPIGWVANFAAAEILSVGIFKRRGGESSLLSGTAFAMLPLMAVPGILSIAQFARLSTVVSNYFFVLLPIVLQVWIVCLLSSAVSISKGLKMEKTAVVSLGVVYMNIIVLIAVLQLGF
jgi:hypothetical protein